MTDQLVEIGRDLAYCRRRINEIDEEVCRLTQCQNDPDAGRKKLWLSNDERSLYDRTDALEQMTTQIQASSLRGVMIQVAMVSHYLAVLREFDLKEDEHSAHCRYIEKLLYSIMVHLEGETQAQREELVGSSYMFREHDPARCLQAVA